MLRIARTQISTFQSTDKQDINFFTSYSRLVALIKKHLSPVTASVFAQPVIQDESDYIEWYSELQGQPEPLLSLPENQQLKVKELLSHRLSSISKLAEQLPQLEPGNAEIQAILQKSIQYPGDKAIYVVNDQPVIIFWGIADSATNHSVLSSSPNFAESASLATPVTKKTSRSLLRTWLLLLSIALFAGLFWLWLSKQSFTLQNYNPFEDEYQLLLDEVNAAENNCSVLKNIFINNVLINKPEEKFVHLKKQVEKRLENCDYQLLLDEVNAAENNCIALENIYNNNALINKTEEKFIFVKKQVEEKLASCEAFIHLRKEIESAQGNCPKLSDILTNNPYFQNSQEPFIELKEQLEKSVQLCTELQQLKSTIYTNKDNCSELSKIKRENPYLQQSKDLFIPLKEQLESYINECNAYKTAEAAIDSARLDCQKLDQLAKENTHFQNPKGKFIKLKEKLNSYQNNCKKEQIETSVNLCPGERPKELAPELVVVFDASFSMAYPPDKHKSQQIDNELARAGGISPMEILAMAMMDGFMGTQIIQQTQKDLFYRLSPAHSSRMQGAKTAVNKLVDITPSDMDIGLVVLKDCPGAQKYGFYSPAKRPQFLGAISNLQPEGGTPLGDAILKAGQMIDGVSKAATMVVISDGEESCDADPCAVARRLAAQKPHLTINVVDILGVGAGNCLAKATPKGKVYTANNMQDIIDMTKMAANTAIPKNCKN